MARHHVKYRYNRIFEASHFSSISLSLIALKLSNPTFCYHIRGKSDGTEAAADIWGKNTSASKCCPSAFPWASHNCHSPPLPHDAYLASAFSWWKCSMGCRQDFSLFVFPCSPSVLPSISSLSVFSRVLVSLALHTVFVFCLSHLRRSFNSPLFRAFWCVRICIMFF